MRNIKSLLKEYFYPIAVIIFSLILILFENRLDCEFYQTIPIYIMETSIGALLLLQRNLSNERDYSVLYKSLQSVFCFFIPHFLITGLLRHFGSLAIQQTEISNLEATATYFWGFIVTEILIFIFGCFFMVSEVIKHETKELKPNDRSKQHRP